jgi:hypothetical protein
LIFVIFLVPLAVYLLVLGHINRGQRHLIVSGVWDFIGVLFASSGFLFAGGPAVLSALSERWRLFWFFGLQGGVGEMTSAGVLLAAGYFVAVLAGSVVVFSRQRRLTSIYNVEPPAVEAALIEACDHLGLDPIHSGNLLVFGLTLEGPPRHAAPEGIQAPHSLPRSGRIALDPPVLGKGALTADEFAGQNAVLELEPFDSVRHVTLRWDPHDSPLRPVLEAELDRRLALRAAPDHDTGVWLSVTGFGLLAIALAIVSGTLLWTILKR